MRGKPEHYTNDQVVRACAPKQLGHCRIQPPKGVATRWNECFSCAGQSQTAGMAHEQCRTESLFEETDLLADGPGGHVQLLRCRREAEVTRRDVKGTEPVYRRFGSDHPVSL
jgi:hypothetical protein